MSLALLFHYLLLNMYRMLLHPSSGAYDLLWIYFMCYIALVRCVLVLRCGSAGVVWYPYAIHNKSQSPEDGRTNIRNMLSSKWWNNKASDIKLVYLYSTIKITHGPINISLPSQIRPFGLKFSIIFGILLLFILVTYTANLICIFLLSRQMAPLSTLSKISSFHLWSKRVSPGCFLKKNISSRLMQIFLIRISRGPNIASILVTGKL